MTKSVASTTLLHTPSVDVAEFTDQLAFAWGVTCGEPVSQYLAWSDRAGLFSLIAAREPMTPLTAALVAEARRVAPLLSD